MIYLYILFIYIHIYHYLSMCICLLTKALMHDACRIRRRGECTDLFNIVCVWFRILCFRVNPWPLFMFASVDLWVLLVFCESSISIFPGGTLIRKVGEKSFFWAMDCSAQDVLKFVRFRQQWWPRLSSQVIVAGPGMTVLTGAEEKGRATGQWTTVIKPWWYEMPVIWVNLGWVVSHFTVNHLGWMGAYTE